MPRNNEIFLKIKVTNTDTRSEHFHPKVPVDHVEMIRLNPKLRVEVIGRSRGRVTNHPMESLYDEEDSENSNVVYRDYSGN
jgi:hypothetical protein